MLVIVIIAIVIIYFFLKNRKKSSKQSIGRIFEKVRQVLTNEEIQNEKLPPMFKSLMKENTLERSISSLYGESPNEPIRVNGSLGEVIYISMLRTPENVPFIGHRLGSLGKIDIYEICSEDFKYWRILFFDLYWLQKDKYAPSGLTLSLNDCPLISAINKFNNTFPNEFWPLVLDATNDLLGVAAVRTTIKEIDYSLISRPKDHSEKLKYILIKIAAYGDTKF